MLTFFIDKNIDSPLFIDPLRQARIFLERHRDHFIPSEEDDVWIPRVAERDWIIVTADERIRFNPVEKRAIIESKAKVLHLTMGKKPYFPDLAANFLNSYKRIEKTFYTTKPPCVAVLHKPKSEDFLSGKSGSIRIIDLQKM